MKAQMWRVSRGEVMDCIPMHKDVQVKAGNVVSHDNVRINRLNLHNILSVKDKQGQA
jgi:hypothetical protein